MNRPQAITVEAYKIWAQKKGISLEGIPDKDLADALDKGNKLEKFFFDQKEEHRQQARLRLIPVPETFITLKVTPEMGS
jgi:hypothetical protein